MVVEKEGPAPQLEGEISSEIMGFVRFVKCLTCFNKIGKIERCCEHESRLLLKTFGTLMKMYNVKSVFLGVKKGCMMD